MVLCITRGRALLYGGSGAVTDLLDQSMTCLCVNKLAKSVELQPIPTGPSVCTRHKLSNGGT